MLKVLLVGVVAKEQLFVVVFPARAGAVDFTVLTRIRCPLYFSASIRSLPPHRMAFREVLLNAF